MLRDLLIMIDFFAWYIFHKSLQAILGTSQVDYSDAFSLRFVVPHKQFNITLNADFFIIPPKSVIMSYAVTKSYYYCRSSL